MKTTVFRIGAALLLASGLAIAPAACGGDDDDTTMDSSPIDPDTGTYSHFVTTDLILPTAGGMYAKDLDGDGLKDDKLGGLLALISTLATGDASLQSNIDNAITEGNLVLLHSVRADDLASDSSVSWSLHLGDATAAPPDFTANPSFDVAADSPTDAKVIGAIAASSFSGGPARKVTLAVVLEEGTEPLRLDLYAASINGAISAEGCGAGGEDAPTITGGVTKEDLDTKLIPAVISVLDTILERDCMPDEGAASLEECNCTASSSGATILGTLDGAAGSGANMGVINCTIEVDEIVDGPFADSLGAQADLFDGDTYGPGKDGVADSLGLGVAFRCAPATFTVAGE